MPNKIEAPVAKAQMLIRKPRWDWEMYGHHTDVDVKAIELNKRILIEWNGPENPSTVEWTSRDERFSQVSIYVCASHQFSFD